MEQRGGERPILFSGSYVLSQQWGQRLFRPQAPTLGSPSTEGPVVIVQAEGIQQATAQESIKRPKKARYTTEGQAMEAGDLPNEVYHGEARPTPS
jgi:hypothetical protein